MYYFYTVRYDHPTIRSMSDIDAEFLFEVKYWIMFHPTEDGRPPSVIKNYGKVFDPAQAKSVIMKVHGDYDKFAIQKLYDQQKPTAVLPAITTVSKPPVEYTHQPTSIISGVKGQATFEYYSTDKASLWHTVDTCYEKGVSIAGCSVFNFIGMNTMGESHRFEMVKNVEGNPLKHVLDVNGNVLSHPDNLNFNIGFLPKTWSDAFSCIDAKTGKQTMKLSRDAQCGSNNPIEVIEISGSGLQMGSITGIRLLGYFQVLRWGIIEYKFLAVHAGHPTIKTIANVDVSFLVSIKSWIKDSEVPFGGGRSVLVDNGRVFSVEDGLELIQTNANSYQNLVYQGAYSTKIDFSMPSMMAVASKQVVYSHTPPFQESGDRERYTWQHQAVDENGKSVSLWHETSLCFEKGVVSPSNCEVFNYVSLMPRGTIDRHVIATNEAGNPIITGTSRFTSYKYGTDIQFQPYYHSGLFFNYGILPKTYSNPLECGSHNGIKLNPNDDAAQCGDGQPISVIELSGDVSVVGSVSGVLVLGYIKMLELGKRVDKIIVVNAASSIKSIDDIHQATLSNLKDWLINYPTAFYDPVNVLLEGGRIFSAVEARELISDSNAVWSKLINGEITSDSVLSGVVEAPKGSVTYKPTAKEEGIFGRRSYKFQAVDDGGKPISLWHDTPLCATDSLMSECQKFNFVSKVPFATMDKMEIMTNIAGNPIQQETDQWSQVIRYSKSFPFNIGSLPKTWSNPFETVDGKIGDGQMIEVLELSGEKLDLGTITEIKFLGYIMVISGDVMSYKILGLRADSSKYTSSIEISPTLLNSIKEFLINQPTATGGSPAVLVDDGKIFGAAEAREIIRKAYESYNKLTIDRLYDDKLTTITLPPKPTPPTRKISRRHSSAVIFGTEGHASFMLITGSIMQPISLWNSVPTCTDSAIEISACNVFNMVTKSSAGSTYRFEIDMKRDGHPFVHETTTTGVVKDYGYGSNVFTKPYYGIGLLFNIGLLPQTWQKNVNCGLHCGDGRPIEVLELSGGVFDTSVIVEVKVLGMIKVLISGRISIKLLTIRSDSAVTSISDISPVLISNLKDFLANHPISYGESPNALVENGKIYSVQEAIEAVVKSSSDWTKLQFDGGFEDEEQSSDIASIPMISPPESQTSDVSTFQPPSIESGKKGTASYSMQATDIEGQKVSLWHSTSPCADGNSKISECDKFNFITKSEIGTTQKFEVSTSTNGNPLKQDVDSNGNLMSYSYGFDKSKSPYYSYGLFFTIGFLPQTWSLSISCDQCGDGRPIEVYEVSGAKLGMGSVTEIKFLGYFKVFVGVKVTYKLLAVTSSSKINSIDDIDSTMFSNIKDFVVNYPTSFGPPANVLNETVSDPTAVKNLIDDNHKSWSKLTVENAYAGKVSSYALPPMVLPTSSSDHPISDDARPFTYMPFGLHFGKKGREDYQFQAIGSGQRVSFWHGLDLCAENKPVSDCNLFNYISTSPMHTKVKYEISKTEKGNPIMQSVGFASGELLSYSWGMRMGTVPYYGGGLFVNVGYLPKTWGDIFDCDPKCGDNELVQVIELSGKAIQFGSVNQVKILGYIGTIRSNVMKSYKMLAVRSDVTTINTIDDVDPLLISRVKEFLKYYPTSYGEAPNALVENGRIYSVNEAKAMIVKSNLGWNKLTIEKAYADKAETKRFAFLSAATAAKPVILPVSSYNPPISTSGNIGTSSYSIQPVNKKNKKVSLLDGVSLCANAACDVYNFVSNNPFASKDKFSITANYGNPIKQDIDTNGNLLSYADKLDFNVGFLPRTLKDGHHHGLTVLELSNTILAIGSITRIKVYGYIIVTTAAGQVDKVILAGRETGNANDLSSQIILDQLIGEAKNLLINYPTGLGEGRNVISAVYSAGDARDVIASANTVWKQSKEQNLLNPSQVVHASQVVTSGQVGTGTYSQQPMKEDGTKLSLWNGVSLCDGTVDDVSNCDVYNLAVTTPIASTEKYSSDLKSEGNPVVADVSKEGNLIQYSSSLSFTIGILPRTWQDPYDSKSADSGTPLTVIELGGALFTAGSIVKIKVIGYLFVIHANYKSSIVILATASTSSITSINGVPQTTLDNVKEHLINHSSADGKKSVLAHNGQVFSAAQAKGVISDMHGFYNGIAFEGAHFDKELGFSLSTVDSFNPSESPYTFDMTKTGIAGTISYSAQPVHAGKDLSLLNDIAVCGTNGKSLDGCDVFNLAVTSSSGTTEKFEFDENIESTPLKHGGDDFGIFSYSSALVFNVGVMPQTYQDPYTCVEGECGSGKPIEIIEIGGGKLDVGAISKITVLGHIKVMDASGRVSVVIIAVPSSLNVNSIDMVGPNLLESVKRFSIDYPVAFGQQKNSLLEEGKIFSVEETKAAIMKSNREWKVKQTSSDLVPLPTSKTTPIYTPTSVVSDDGDSIQPIDSSGKPLSLWHSTSMYKDETNKVFNLVTAQTSGTSDKFTLQTTKSGNPLHKEISKVKPYNVGFLPQTWQGNINCLAPNCGDQTPVTVLELSGDKLDVGSVAGVKILGMLKVIMSSKTSSVVLTTRSDDTKLSVLTDVDADLIATIKNSLVNITNVDGSKTPIIGSDGTESMLVDDGKIFTIDEALAAITSANSAWTKLVTNHEYQDTGLALPPGSSADHVPSNPFIPEHVVQSGVGNGNYSFQAVHNGKKVSLWHGISPCSEDKAMSTCKTLNFVSTIPLGTHHKLDVQKSIDGNPIQHTLNMNGQVVTYDADLSVNVGILPRTWSDLFNCDNNQCGDGHPLTALEVSSSGLVTGSVTKTKILGSIKSVLGGKISIYVIVVNVDDININSINDIDSTLLQKIKDFVKTTPGTALIDDGKIFSVAETRQFIVNAYNAWAKLTFTSAFVDKNLPYKLLPKVSTSTSTSYIPEHKQTPLGFQATTDSVDVSLWHGADLCRDKDCNTLNMVLETPSGSNAKMKVQLGVDGNPISQEKDESGEMGTYDYQSTATTANGGLFFNLGILPQTYLDKNDCGFNADGLKLNPSDEGAVCNDGKPIQVIEIPSAPLQPNSITGIKILGSLSMFEDNSRKSFKIIATRADNTNINGISDVSADLMADIKDWLVNHKVGNAFEDGGIMKSVAETKDLIMAAHASWSELILDPSKDSSLALLPTVNIPKPPNSFLPEHKITGTITTSQPSTSLWHDVHLQNPSGTYNYVTLTSKGTRAKNMLMVKQEGNPIKQERSADGKLLSYSYGLDQTGLHFNIGFLPQTSQKEAGGHPIDVFEISGTASMSKAVNEIRIIGYIKVIDSNGKVFVKVLASGVTSGIETAADIDMNLLSKIQTFITHSGVPFGHKPNTLSSEGWIYDVDQVKKMIDDSHGFWTKLVVEQLPALNEDYGFALRDTTTSTPKPSPWHDIKLCVDKSCDKMNFITTVPIGTTAVNKIQKKLPGNPIQPDLNQFGDPISYTYGTIQSKQPYYGIGLKFTIGVLPQTWLSNVDCGNECGDGEPLQVIMLGDGVGMISVGEKITIRILGVIKVVEGGKTIPRIIAIADDNTNIGSILDIDANVLNILRDFIINYKVPLGGSQNTLLEDSDGDEIFSPVEAKRIVKEANIEWAKLSIENAYADENLGYTLPAAVAQPVGISDTYVPKHVETGVKGSADYTFQMINDGKKVSLWHTLLPNVDPTKSISASTEFHFVTTTPFGSKARSQVSKETDGNPIKHLVSVSGEVESYEHGLDDRGNGLVFNVGVIPRTWSDLYVSNGDGNFVQVIEVSGDPLTFGSVTKIRILGYIRAVTNGKSSDKIIAVRSSNNAIKSIADVPSDIMDKVNEFAKNSDGNSLTTSVLSVGAAVSAIEKGNNGWTKLVIENAYADKSEVADYALQPAASFEVSPATPKSQIANDVYIPTHIETGVKDTASYTFQAVDDQTNQQSSLWHAAPLCSTADTPCTTFNMVTTTPQRTRIKHSISKTSSGNPIKPSINAAGEVVSYTHGLYSSTNGLMFNMGVLPQTWNDLYGDNGNGELIEVLEVSGSELPFGSITTARILGSITVTTNGKQAVKIIAVRDSDSRTGIGEIPSSVLDSVKDFLKNNPDGSVNIISSIGSVADAIAAIVKANQGWDKLAVQHAYADKPEISTFALHPTAPLHASSTKSPWHDVLLHPQTSDDNTVNYIITSPIGTTAVNRVQKSTRNNPIKQLLDSNGNSVEYMYDVDPDGLKFSIGILPQTWKVNVDCRTCFGPGDLVYVVDVSGVSASVGSGGAGRLLGHMQVTEADGSTLIVVLIVPDYISSIMSISDVDLTLLLSIQDFFVNYKGAGKNTLLTDPSDDGKIFPMSETKKVVRNARTAWAELAIANDHHNGYGYALPPSVSLPPAASTTYQPPHSETGTPGSAQYIFQPKTNNQKVSLWHTLPPNADFPTQPISDSTEFNFLSTIPLGTNQKLAIQMKIDGNPIKQETGIAGNLLTYSSGVGFNLGVIPRTWSDVYGGVNGDGGLLEVIEVGGSVLMTGTISKVKLLGVMRITRSDGKSVNKVIAVKSDGTKISSIDDVPSELLDKIKSFLKINPDPLDTSTFTLAEDGRVYSVADAKQAVADAHAGWVKLVIDNAYSDKDDLPNYSLVPASAETTLPSITSDGKLDSSSSVDFAFQTTSSDGTPISPWHDTNLIPDEGTSVQTADEFHFVTTSSFGTTAKLSLATGVANNPIIQDKIQPHYNYGMDNTKSPFYGESLNFNIGFLPQTWQDKFDFGVDPITGQKLSSGGIGAVGGNNQPLAVIELSGATIDVGSVTKVKILGSIQVVNDGQKHNTDQEPATISKKSISHNYILAVSSDKHQINSIDDVDPIFMSEIKDWLKNQDGFVSEIGDGGKISTALQARQKIVDAHSAWQKLANGEYAGQDLLDLALPAGASSTSSTTKPKTWTYIPHNKQTSTEGQSNFAHQAVTNDAEGNPTDTPTSLWRDVLANFDKGKSIKDSRFFNFVCESPMGSKSKSSIKLDDVDNPITPMLNADGAVSSHDYGTSTLKIPYYGDGLFFNAGFIAQTWQNNLQCDGSVCNENGAVNVIEVSGQPLELGSVTGVKLLGHITVVKKLVRMHYILAIRGDNDAVNSIEDLDPTLIKNIKDYLTNHDKPSSFNPGVDTYIPDTTTAGQPGTSTYSVQPRKDDQKLSVRERSINEK